MPEGWREWLEWQRTVCPENTTEIQAVETDAGEYLGYVRVVGRRLADAKLEEPIASMPFQYTHAPLRRS
jgi:hypothetical protein